MSTTKYPLNIDQDPHVRIITRSYALPAADNTTALIKDSEEIANSYFYIPHLALAAGTSWQAEEVTKTVTDAAAAWAQGKGTFKTAWEGVKGAGTDAIKGFDKLAMGSLANAERTGAALLGGLIRPNDVLVLDSVNRFSINLSFELKAQSQEEGAMVKTIISNFRKWSQPTLVTENGSSHMILKYPPIFDIVFNPKKSGLNTVSWKTLNEGLYTYKNMVLESFNVSITGGANEALFYSDETPVNAIMDLGFKSLRPGWNNEFNDSGDK